MLYRKILLLFNFLKPYAMIKNKQILPSKEPLKIAYFY